MTGFPKACIACGQPSFNGPRCAAHVRQRGTSGSDRQRKRRAVLMRDPICTRCGAAPSAEAHHVVPLYLGGPDTVENMTGLCSPCHDGITRPFTPRRAPRW